MVSILITDDNKSVRVMLRLLLEEYEEKDFEDYSLVLMLSSTNVWFWCKKSSAPASMSSRSI